MIAHADPVADILIRLQGVKETSVGHYQARCPAHDDRKASLCITRGADGRALLKCQAGCQTISVATKLGLNMRDLFVSSEQRARDLGRIAKTYDYHGPDGELRFQCTRHSPKDFRQRRPDGKGGWVWDLRGVQRVLYRLPDLNEADSAALIFIPEGEKDVDRLWDMGLVATCNPMGAGKWLADYNETLRGRQVIILPDNDSAGQDHAREVARNLHGVASSVRILELPKLPAKGDVSDWVDAGGTTERLNALACAAPKWRPVNFVAEALHGGLRPPMPEQTARDSRSRRRFAAELTDTGNGERFAQMHAGRARYCHPLDCWFVQDGKRWKADDTGAAVRLAKEVSHEIWKEALAATDERRGALQKWAMQSEGADKIRKMLWCAQSELPILTERLDADPWLLNTKTGTIDLRTGQLREHSPADLITKMAPVDYAGPEVPAPMWEQFIVRISDGNAALINYLQKLTGMFLTGDVSVQELFIFHGGGANGKSVFLDTTCAVMGDYACEAANSLLTTGRSEHPTELADLHGRRLVIASETEEDARLRIQVVKQLTGNKRIKARKMRQDFVEFDRTHKLVLVTNSKPIVTEATHAIWRRLRLVPFGVTIPRAEWDTGLTDKLVSREGPGILAWMVRGCLLWQLDGLEPPAEVTAATETYRAEQDKLGDFIADRLIVGPPFRVPRNDAYAEYQSYAHTTGEKHPLDRNSLFDRLRRIPGVTETQTRVGGAPVRVFKGIGLCAQQAQQAQQGATPESESE